MDVCDFGDFVVMGEVVDFYGDVVWVYLVW